MATTSEAKLLKAARRCDGAALEAIVGSDKANLDATDQTGCSAVHHCAKSADLRSLAILLQHGARVDIFDHAGMTALHHAAGKDYVETMSLLISHGADINIRNQQSSMTTLQYSIQQGRHKSSEFLLFCGADNEDMKDKIAGVNFIDMVYSDHEEVRAGFKNRTIQLEGKYIMTHGKFDFKTLNLTIKTHDNNPAEFMFLCRRSFLEQSSNCVTNTDNSDVISDVFAYLLNVKLRRVLVTIRVYIEASRFDAVYVKDNRNKAYKCSHVRTDETGIVYKTVMTLYPYEDSMNSFAVYMGTKSDIFITTGNQQKCQSTVEPNFQIELSESSLPANVAVRMMVFPVIGFVERKYTEEIMSASNICNVNFERRHRRPVRTQVPLPTDVRTGDDVRVYHADTLREGADDCVFEEVPCDIDNTSGHAVLRDPSIANGTSIAAHIRGTEKFKEGFTRRVKRFLSWLYSVVKTRQRHVVFYGLSKVGQEPSYHLLLVGLSPAENAESDISKWKKDDYVIKSSQMSSPVLCKPKQIFRVACTGIKATVFGRQELRLSQHLNRGSHQEFPLSLPEGCGYGQISVYLHHQGVRQLEARRKEFDDFVTQLTVELKTDGGPDTRAYQTFTVFPYSDTLAWLAKQIGSEWFLLGISLGYPSSFLERIDTGNSANRRIATMLYAWRKDNDMKPDMGLSALYQGLTAVGRNDIISEINRKLNALMKERPGETAAKWARSLASDLDDVDAPSDDSSGVDFQLLIGDRPVASPFSEQFLLAVVVIVGARFEITQQLGVPATKTASFRDSCSDHPDTAMFKCLVFAQRQYGERGEKFIKDLLAALRLQENNEAVERIVDQCTRWMTAAKSGTEDEKKKRKRLQSVLSKCIE